MATPFKQGTKNHTIFENTAPYDNRFQGTRPRWLFVCSAGLLRAPTGAALAIQRGINARSCGSAIDYALIPISANLVNWAHKIVFVNPENRDQALNLFRDYPDEFKQLLDKQWTLDIPDIFEYMHPDLVAWFEQDLFNE